MKNLELGQLVLKQIESDPDSFDMAHQWGDFHPCGTKACLAGHAMLLSGYTLKSRNVFIRPNGQVVKDVEQEAFGLLGLTNHEWWGFGNAGQGLFYIDSNQLAVEIFRKLVEQEEIRRAYRLNGGLAILGQDC